MGRTQSKTPSSGKLNGVLTTKAGERFYQRYDTRFDIMAHRVPAFFREKGIRDAKTATTSPRHGRPAQRLRPARSFGRCLMLTPRRKAYLDRLPNGCPIREIDSRRLRALAAAPNLPDELRAALRIEYGFRFVRNLSSAEALRREM